MKIAGLMATVPWRSASFEKALHSVLAQNFKFDAFVLFFDGFTEVKEAPQELRDSVKTICTITNLGAGCGGGWDRFPHALGAVNDDYVIHTFDDDLIYPPGYCEEMQAACERLHCPVTAHGFNKITQARYHFSTAQTRDVQIHEPGLGVSVIPASAIRNASKDPLASKFLHSWTCEVFLGYYWEKIGVPCFVPKHTCTPKIQPEALDKRAVFSQHGRGEQQKLREQLYAAKS